MSLETELFKLISKKKYPEAITLLTNNKEVNINALNEEGCSLLMTAIEKSFSAPKERYTFIELLLSNPDFQHANLPINEMSYSTTPFEMAIIKDDPILIELILKYKEEKGIEVVFDKDKLLYETQVQKIQRTKDRQAGRQPFSILF